MDNENLQIIRSRLHELRNNRTAYIQSSEVENLFRTLSDSIKPPDLQALENDALLPDRYNSITPTSRLLDEVLLLMSLTYMTVGKNNEPPAVYSTLVVVKILLNHLTEASVYSRHDLKAVEAKLNAVQNSLEQAEVASIWVDILGSLLGECRKALIIVKQRLDGLSPLLDPVYEKLVSLRRQITAAGTRPKVVLSEIQELQANINEVDESRVDGKFLAADGTAPEGQDLTLELLSQCKAIAIAIQTGMVKVEPALAGLHKKLSDTKGELEKLTLTQAWSMRETDLFDHLQLLRQIDGDRVDGKFIGSDGTAPEEGQRILLYLLRKSYAMIYELLYSSKPISESLQPIFNQLSTLKKCLLEVQNSGGVSSPRDLFPFSIKLASIDNLRKEGKFYVGKEIPEGQGAVNGLLEDCYEICHELRCQTEEVPS